MGNHMNLPPRRPRLLTVDLGQDIYESCFGDSDSEQGTERSTTSLTMSHELLSLKDLAYSALHGGTPSSATGGSPRREVSWHSAVVGSTASNEEHLENFLSERVHATSSRFKVTRVEIEDEDHDKAPISVFDDPENVLAQEKAKTAEYGTSVEKRYLNLYEDDPRFTAETVQNAIQRTVTIDEEKVKANLGTFFGVFLPCCQNIVGVIYFVRFPWIVGCGGILDSLIIVFLCNLMSFTTAISMSAIATNGRVTAGGTYFMISRSLGPAVGGSVGLLFFMGTSISVAMYYLGTIEILLKYIAPELALFSTTADDLEGRYNDFRVYGSIQLLVMATIVFLGVKYVSRVAFGAIIFLVLALTSVFVGMGVFAFDNSGSEKVCVLGDRAMKYSLIHNNNTLECNKEIGSPLYNAYCVNYPNGTEICDEFFINNNASLIPAIPGFSIKLLKEQFSNFYTEKYDIPGTDIKANLTRDIFTDIATSFVFLFSIYFPSITGVESGSNYSGDLANPNVAIPRGTLLAVTVTSLIYLSSVVLFGASVEGVVLRDKYGESISEHGDLILSLMAYPSKYIVLTGAMTATIGAGMQALAGGPRLLQAIAEDQILPSLGFFARKWLGEPIRALLATFFIAETGILIANLDYVAPIVTMFFLMCYGFINFAVTLQSLVDTLHWRPSFRYYHWVITLLGTSLCVVTMFICSWKYALIAIVMAFLLYEYIEFKGAEKEWGDGITGLSMSAALYALSRLRREFTHTKNWRPQVFVLLKIDQAEMGELEVFKQDDRNLVELAAMMKEGKGLLMFGTVLKGKLSDLLVEKKEAWQLYNKCLDDANVKGFVELAVSENVVAGLSMMIQSAGLGALRPNTIVMGWPKEWTDTRNISSYNTFLSTMRNVALLRNAVIVLKSESEFPTREDRLSGTIDVWWIVNDGGMLLLLAFLMQRNKTWSKCKLRVFSVAQEDDNTLRIKTDLENYLYQLRLDATVEVVEMLTTDISAYVYERTLKLEERTRILQAVQFRSKSKNEAQSVLERARSTGEIKVSGSQKSKTVSHDFSSSADAKQKNKPSEENLRHMNTAVRLNELLLKTSLRADLIILNLPCVPESEKGQANYMSFLEVLTEGLDRLLLVRGTGSEVITIFN